MGLIEVHSIGLHTLTRQAEIIFDQKGDLFDGYAYSRFKYGSRSMSAQYSAAIAELVRQKFPQLLVRDFWFTSSAYKYVPTASDSLTQAMHTLKRGKKVKVARTKLFPADYGNLSQAEREAIMGKVDMFFELACPTPKPEDLLVIDDIRITGAHEQRLIDFAKAEGFKRVYFVYVAHLSPKCEPTTEHWLNHMAVRNLTDLWDLWKTEGYILNARICKFLLSYPNTEALARFACALPARLRQQIAEGMQKDGYADMEMYLDNWAIWEVYQSSAYFTKHF